MDRIKASKRFLLINLLLSALLISGCPNNVTDYVMLSLALTTIEQGNSSILTVSWNSTSDKDVTFTATTYGAVQFFPDNTCTITGGSGSCTITILADFLASTGRNQIRVTPSDPHVPVVNSPLNFTIEDRAGQLAYISDVAEDEIYYCSVASSGDLNNSCQVANVGSAALTFPVQLSLHTASDGVTYAYIANGDFINAGIYYCPLTDSGDLNGCQLANTAGIGLFIPTSISFHTAADGTDYAYIASRLFNPGVYYCSVTGSGDLANCQAADTGTTIIGPEDIAFHLASNGETYAYITETRDPDRIDYCSVSSNGDLVNCQPANIGTSLSNPEGIAFYTADNGTTYAYITTTGNPSEVYHCPVTSDGDFNGCSTVDTTGASLDVPRTIAFNAASNGQVYAYIAEATNDVVYYCPITSDGNFNGCNATSASGESASGLAFY